MPRKKKIDYNKLISAIDSGKKSKEIQDEFGFQTAAQLRAAYAEALMDKGKATKIKTGRANKAKRSAQTISVNSRGSLIIPKDAITSLGFAEDDMFIARKSKSGISLRKVEAGAGEAKAKK